tara:strand:+ start:1191 stop:1427 length:237 start_codon:yes stop_codon:yes gene_type:complete
MFTKKEIEYMNSTNIWNDTIEVVENDIDNYDSFTIYKKKDEDKYLAIPINLFITNELAEKFDNKLMQNLHNNRIRINS